MKDHSRRFDVINDRSICGKLETEADQSREYARNEARVALGLNIKK